MSLVLPLGFMHLPKTGGISVRGVITSHLPSLRIAPSPKLGIWELTPDHIGRYDLYSGHFEYRFFDKIGNQVLKLTMLRHPLRRMVSLYDYWRGFTDGAISAITEEIPDNGPLFASSVDFYEFIRNPTPFVRTHVENGLTRQLLGKSYNASPSNYSAMVHEAKRRLCTFDWIGITERFDASIQELAKRVGFTLSFDIPRINSSYIVPPDGLRRVVAPTRPTKTSIDLVRETNSIDIELYDRFSAKL
jgi:Sulfotransferase family